MKDDRTGQENPEPQTTTQAPRRRLRLVRVGTLRNLVGKTGPRVDGGTVDPRRP
jgi:hypothetical protein